MEKEGAPLLHRDLFYLPYDVLTDIVIKCVVQDPASYSNVRLSCRTLKCTGDDKAVRQVLQLPWLIKSVVPMPTRVKRLLRQYSSDFDNLYVKMLLGTSLFFNESCEEVGITYLTDAAVSNLPLSRYIYAQALLVLGQSGESFDGMGAELLASMYKNAEPGRGTIIECRKQFLLMLSEAGSLKIPEPIECDDQTQRFPRWHFDLREVEDRGESKITCARCLVDVECWKIWISYDRRFFLGLLHNRRSG